MVIPAGTRLSMCTKPQQTAEMNASYCQAAPHVLGDQDSEPVAAPLHGADEGALAPPDEADITTPSFITGVAVVVTGGHVTVCDLGHLLLRHVPAPFITPWSEIQ